MVPSLFPGVGSDRTVTHMKKVKSQIFYNTTKVVFSSYHAPAFQETEIKSETNKPWSQTSGNRSVQRLSTLLIANQDHLWATQKTEEEHVLLHT